MLLQDAMEEQKERHRKLCWKWEQYNFHVEEMYHGAVTLVVDLAKAFVRVQLKVVWASAMHFGFPQRVLRWLRGYFQPQRRVLFEVCVADDPLQTVAVDIPCSKWSVLLLSIVMQVAMSEVLKVYPQLDDKKE